MNFLEPQPTSFDLRWRMFGIPIRVHPGFWVFAAILGWHYFQAWGFSFLLVWIGCTLLSILIHELGHAVAGFLCGRPAHIVLYWLGGLAVGQFQLARAWQRILISLAGPGVGLAFFLLLLFAGPWFLTVLDPAGGNPWLRRAFGMLLFMNLFWNLMNLIPVFPLDGGQVLRDVLQAISPRQGLRLALGASFLIAGCIAVYAFLAQTRDLWLLNLDPTFTAIIFAILAMQNFMLLQDERQRRRWDEPEW